MPFIQLNSRLTRFVMPVGAVGGSSRYNALTLFALGVDNGTPSGVQKTIKGATEYLQNLSAVSYSSYLCSFTKCSNHP
jgi:hypothetical protein